MIVKVLDGIEGVGIFVDDIIVYSKTEQEHINTVKLVLNRLAEKNIKINSKKNCLGSTEIKYLGFKLSKNGYSPDKERLEDFTLWKRSTTRRQLQERLGKINWYRPFLRNLSDRLSPFYDQLKGKSKKVKITDDQMKIFADLHSELLESAQLYFPDLNDEFFINADACENGVGAILYQKGGIIAYSLNL